jgi:hypothetical protein
MEKRLQSGSAVWCMEKFNMASNETSSALQRQDSRIFSSRPLLEHSWMR